jgi:hypothetical protein
VRKLAFLALTVVAALGLPACADIHTQAVCDPSYPDNCIFLAPPNLDCKDIPHRSFRVQGSDPHQLDQDGDGFGCSRRDIQLEWQRYSSP